MIPFSPRSLAILAVCFVALATLGAQCPLGLSASAYVDLVEVGVNRYVGMFRPASSEPAADGWTKHTFDTRAGDGPVCLDGTPLTVFTRARDPQKVAIYFAGGGACWQDFYYCTARARNAPPDAAGIFVDAYDPGDGNVVANPLADWSMVYVSSCDGSFFGGDNRVVDPSYPWGGVRHHRGVRNVTAALDLARTLFPEPARVLLAGTSAGGYGVAGVVPLVARFEWWNGVPLYVFDDSGPALYNFEDAAAVEARIDDWAYTQFYPSSCESCGPDRQPAELLAWLLDQDVQVRSALYSTDGDVFIRYYLGIPTQAAFRELLLATHDPLHAAFPDRHKRFVPSAPQHGALPFDFFYTAELLGVPLYRWLDDFVEDGPGWVDLVAEAAPQP